jgi:hypothetical protein
MWSGIVTLPDRIFLTGVPGSRWSGVAQDIEQVPGFNTSDRTPERTYEFTTANHQGAYFGRGMEFEPILNQPYIDSAWTEQGGCRLVKSHDWAYSLDDIKAKFPNDWIMLVYRPDVVSYAWWHQAGGFNIKYPNYSAYVDPIGMLHEITLQNQAILEFGHKHCAKWCYFTEDWVAETFGHRVTVDRDWPDVLVSIVK